MTKLIEEAKAKLILFYGIDNPTEQQIATYILFGTVEGKKAQW